MFAGHRKIKVLHALVLKPCEVTRYMDPFQLGAGRLHGLMDWDAGWQVFHDGEEPVMTFSMTYTIVVLEYGAGNCRNIHWLAIPGDSVICIHISQIMNIVKSPPSSCFFITFLSIPVSPIDVFSGDRIPGTPS